MENCILLSEFSDQTTRIVKHFYNNSFADRIMTLFFGRGLILLCAVCSCVGLEDLIWHGCICRLYVRTHIIMKLYFCREEWRLYCVFVFQVVVSGVILLRVWVSVSPFNSHMYLPQPHDFSKPQFPIYNTKIITILTYYIFFVHGLNKIKIN